MLSRLDRRHRRRADIIGPDPEEKTHHRAIRNAQPLVGAKADVIRISIPFGQE
jgi:hypothetical protein